MGISICVPTFNRFSYIKRFVESVRDGIGNYPYEIIVADGGSNDGTIEYLKKQDEVILVEMGELSGGVKAYNEGFKKITYEYTFWPSDDFIVNSKVLIKCCKLMDKYPEIGLVSTKMQDEFYNNFPSVGISHRYLTLSKTHVFRTSVLKKINFLDDTFRSYFVDGDSTLSVLNLGYAIISTREVGVIHTRVFDETLKRNRKSIEDPLEVNHFNQKWNGLTQNIMDHLQHSPLKKLKSLLFFYLSFGMFHSLIFREMMKKQNPFFVKFYDWILQQGIVFEAKEYEHLKEFYLAQKLPVEVIQHS